MAKYKFKSVLLSGGGTYSNIEKDTAVNLNELFDDGWEYVESIIQTVSTGSTAHVAGSIIAILKKEEGINL